MEERKYHQGYFDCVAETLKFLIGSYGDVADENFKVKLLSHLTTYYAKFFDSRSKDEQFILDRQSNRKLRTSPQSQKHTNPVDNDQNIRLPRATVNFEFKTDPATSYCKELRYNVENSAAKVVDRRVVRRQQDSVEQGHQETPPPGAKKSKFCQQQLQKQIFDRKMVFTVAAMELEKILQASEGHRRKMVRQPERPDDSAPHSNFDTQFSISATATSKPLNLAMKKKKDNFLKNIDDIDEKIIKNGKTGNFLCTKNVVGGRLRQILESREDDERKKEVEKIYLEKLRMSHDRLQTKLWDRFADD